MIHLWFIAIGYDDDQNVGDVEVRVAPEIDPPPEEAPKEQASRVPRWLVVLAVLAPAGVVVAVIVYGYLDKPGWVGVAGKKFWDYLDLLIVPAALAIGVYLLNRAQQERERKADETQQQRQLEIENQRAQDEALQAYLDQMSQLLLDKDRPLRESEEGDEVRTLARARTLTVLARLDGERKRNVVEFLYESGVLDTSGAVLSLTGADLRGAKLGLYNLSRVDLHRSDLRGANLSVAILHKADLSGANMQGANLRGAYLRESTLRGTNLSQAQLSEANLSEAELGEFAMSGPDLSGEDLRGIDLIGRDLSGTLYLRANLGESDITDQQLAQCKGLEDTRMPDGQSYETWLETPRGQTWLKNYKTRIGEDRENGNLS